MRNRQAAIPFIFVTVMLDMVALGLIAPVLPNLILSFVNNDMTRTAIWNGIFLTVFAAMQFFFSPVIGVLSDRFGRRPVLLLSNVSEPRRALAREYQTEFSPLTPALSPLRGEGARSRAFNRVSALLVRSPKGNSL